MIRAAEISKRWQIGLALASVVFSLVALGISLQSNRIAERSNEIAEEANRYAEGANRTAIRANAIAEEANELAKQSYEIAYQSNLPVISAISKTYRDETTGLYTEKITVSNSGGVLREFKGSGAAIMNIGSGETEVHVPLDGYFVEREYTGSSQGLLLTTSRENNLSQYWLISREFREAGQKDGYDPLIWLRLILNVDYEDYTGKSWSKSFSVTDDGSSEMQETDARKILDSASRSRELAASKDLELYVWELKGAELWDWYKEEMLKQS